MRRRWNSYNGVTCFAAVLLCRQFISMFHFSDFVIYNEKAIDELQSR